MQLFFPPVFFFLVRSVFFFNGRSFFCIPIVIAVGFLRRKRWRRTTVFGFVGYPRSEGKGNDPSRTDEWLGHVPFYTGKEKWESPISSFRPIITTTWVYLSFAHCTLSCLPSPLPSSIKDEDKARQRRNGTREGGGKREKKNKRREKEASGECHIS